MEYYVLFFCASVIAICLMAMAVEALDKCIRGGIKVFDRSIRHYKGFSKCSRCIYFNQDDQSRKFLPCGWHGDLKLDCSDFTEIVE